MLSLFARRLGCQGCHPDMFHVVPGTTVLDEFKMEKYAPRAAECSFLQVESSRQIVIMELKISQVKDIVPDTVQKLVNFRKIEISSRIEINESYWKNHQSLWLILYYPCVKNLTSNLETSVLVFVAVYRQDAHMCV